jgi:hypothetical protein
MATEGKQLGRVMNSIDNTLAERESRYGSFLPHARITQDLKRAMQRGRNWNRLKDDQRETLEMIAHKVGRILNGDPDYHDSWHDIIGYTKLVADRLETAEKARAVAEADRIASQIVSMHHPDRAVYGGDPFWSEPIRAGGAD